MKKRSERCKHCALAVVWRSQKFSPRCRPPSRGRGTAKPTNRTKYFRFQKIIPFVQVEKNDECKDIIIFRFQKNVGDVITI